MLSAVLHLIQGVVLGLTGPLALGGIWLVAINAQRIIATHPQWPPEAPPREAFLVLAICAIVSAVCLYLPSDSFTLAGAVIGISILANRRALPLWS